MALTFCRMFRFAIRTNTAAHTSVFWKLFLIMIVAGEFIYPLTVANANAEIFAPPAPEIGRQIVQNEVRARILADGKFFRGVQFKDITISPPHRWYTVHMEDAVSGNLLSRAASGCWRYILLHGTNACGVVTLVDADGKSGGKPSIGALYQTCFSDETIEALRKAEVLPQIKKRDYEIRLMSDMANAFHAVWLHGESDDIIMPLPPAYGRVTPYKPYTENELCEIFIKTIEHQKKIGSGASQQFH